VDLFIHKIFFSLQGESSLSGFPSVFIRLAGCNLRCAYCDTKEAYEQNHKMSIVSIIEQVSHYQGSDHLTITGGEPLWQKNVYLLFEELLKKDYKIQLETNGSLNLKRVPEVIRKIVDVKTPSSQERDSFLLENLDYLTKNDEIKFVIATKEDYIFSKNFIKKHLTKTETIINFSPVEQLIDPVKLAKMILEDKLKVRLNLQMHKSLGLC